MTRHAVCGWTLALFALAPPLVRADEAPWRFDAEQSTLSFTATQQGAPFKGVFEQFQTEIHFAPEDPGNGHIVATIVVDSVNTRNEDRDNYLRGADFFHVEMFPRARFETHTISAAADGTFVARAMLTLRDITREVRMTFRWQPGPSGSVHFTADVPLKRLDFGVGQGVWRDTDWIGPEVLVQVDLTLLPT